jgi:Cu(I)/Ag(I) efflux system membrane fusion protein
MTSSDRSRRLNRGVLIGIGALFLAALIWLAASRGKKETASRTQRADSSMASVPGMPGMPSAQSASNGSVELTASQLRQFGVTFDTVKSRTLQNEVRTVGTVTFDETRIAQVSVKFSGFVERLYVNTTGQPVQRGQALASIYSPDLVAAQQELIVAARFDRSMGESSVPGAPAGGPNLLTAARNRLRLWDISDAQINTIVSTGRVQRALTLFSPVSGIVTQKNVVQGQSVMAGMPLMTIADLSTVWIEADLRESDAGNVRVGASATVELNAFPGQRLAGRVTYVYPTLEQEARAIKARILLSNSGGRIKPGMYAIVRLASPMGMTLTVPASALVETGERTFVFVETVPGKFTPRDVRIGRRAGDYVEVLSGVNPGQRVVTSAQFLIDSESNLGEVMRSMIGAGGSGTMGDKGADMQGMQMPSAVRK